jgi:hypothetical protein
VEHRAAAAGAISEVDFTQPWRRMAETGVMDDGMALLLFQSICSVAGRCGGCTGRGGT